MTMLARLLLLLLALPMVAESAGPAESPRGWRLPRATELSVPGDHWRDDSPANWPIVEGDFEGNGHLDKAVFLVSNDSKYFGVFVRLTDDSWRRLIRLPIADIQSMGLSRIEPGKYLTACGKGYWQCSKEEPAQIELTHDAILLHKKESAMSAFVWSSSKKEFQRVWLSD